MLCGRRRRRSSKLRRCWRRKNITSRGSPATRRVRLRTVQRNYWDHAVKGLSDPVSSPHTVCFQTLPDHWRMITRLGTGELALNANLLGSGNFEDAESIFSEGWGHEQVKIPGVRASAELYPLPDRVRGSYCLWLVAAPEAGEDPLLS